MSGLTVKWIDRWQDLPGGEAGLAALAAQVPEATVFSTWDWLEAAARHLLEPERRLVVLTVRRGPELVACLPLTAGRERLRGLTLRTLRFLGDPLADRTPALIVGGDPGAGAATFRALASCPVDWDVMVLSELPDAPDAVAATEAGIDETGWTVERRLTARVPLLFLNGRDRNSLMLSYRKGLRTRLQRARGRSARAGNLVYQHLPVDADGLDRTLGVAKAIEDASWKGARGLGIFSTPERFAFFRELAARFRRHGWLRVRALSLDGKPISYRFGFCCGGRFLDYNLAFLPQFGQLSPGRVLLDEVILEAADEGLTAVDASRASLNEGHLLSDWTDTELRHYRLLVFANSLGGRLARLIEGPGRRLYLAAVRHVRS